MPHAEVGAMLKKVRAADVYLASKLALEFLVLTAARSGEVRYATWSEVSLDDATWTIPGERMKASNPHRVPLCASALAILEEMRPLRDGSDLLFPGARRGPLGDMTFNRILEKIGAKVTTHGFRSSFRDWCAENNKPQEIAEAALAHTVAGVEGAYFRSDLFDPTTQAHGRLGRLSKLLSCILVKETPPVQGAPGALLPGLALPSLATPSHAMPTGDFIPQKIRRQDIFSLFFVRIRLASACLYSPYQNRSWD